MQHEKYMQALEYYSLDDNSFCWGGDKNFKKHSE